MSLHTFTILGIKVRKSEKGQVDVKREKGKEEGDEGKKKKTKRPHTHKITYSYPFTYDQKLYKGTSALRGRAGMPFSYSPFWELPPICDIGVALVNMII